MEQKQFEAMLSDAEIRLRRLKTLYDQWLSGFERLEPTVPRKELDDLFVRLKREQIRNTALRFRLHQVHQRYLTFTTYWKRLSRQIEEGTYQRDVLKARRQREEREDGKREGAAADGPFEVDVDVDLDAALAAAAQAAEAPAALPPSEAPAPRQAEKNAVAAASPSAISAPPVPTPSQNAPATPISGGPNAGDAKKPPPIPGRSPVGPRSISPFALPLPPSAASKPPVVPGMPSRAPAAAATGTPSKAPPLPPTVVKPQVPALPAALRPPPSMNKPATPAKAPAAAAPAPGALSSDDVQRIYARYVAARKDNSERVDNVRIENIEKSLRGMLPQLEKKHAGKKIDFEVIVKDGTVALKPVAK